MRCGVGLGERGRLRDWRCKGLKLFGGVVVGGGRKGGREEGREEGRKEGRNGGMEEGIDF